MEFAGVKQNVMAGGRLNITGRQASQAVMDSGASFGDMLLGAGMDMLGEGAIFDSLSATSKDLLHKIKNNVPISKEEWQGLTRELLNKGIITKEEFDITQGYQLIPISKSGKASAVLLESLKKLTRGEDPSGWNGNPMDYLDNWLGIVKSMRNERDEHGRLMFDREMMDKEVSDIDSVRQLLGDLLKN